MRFLVATALALLTTASVAQERFISASLGYSETYGKVLGADVHLPDLFGDGSGLDLGYRRDDRGSSGSLQAGLGALGDLPGGGALTLSLESRVDDWRDAPFSTERDDVAVRARFPAGADTSVFAELFSRNDVIFGVTPATSALVADEAGARRLTGLRLGWSADHRDNPLLPVRGWEAGAALAAAVAPDGSGQTEIAGRLAAHQPIGALGILSLSAEAGQIGGFGGGIPRITDRAFMGGDLPRGFAPGGLGPRDPITETALGGETYAGGSVSIAHDLADIGGFATRISAFADAGSVWNLTNTQAAPGEFADDALHWRTSAGIALTLAGERGRLDISLARPIQSQPGDLFREVGFAFRMGF